MGRAVGLSENMVREKLALLERSMRMVKRLRRAVYEDLNQLQHEYLCFRMVSYLRRQDRKWSGLRWYYHARQTSHKGEADVIGKRNGRVVVQAEVTTASRPIGSIREGMRKKLNELVSMPGKHKYYGVATRSMLGVARGLAKETRVKAVLLR